MKIKSIKRMFSAAFWPSLLISAVGAVAPVHAVTPLAYLQSQTAPTFRPGNTMLRLARCGWPYLGDGTNKQLDLDTQKELAGRWGYVLQLSGWAGDLGGTVWDDPNSFDRALIDFAKNNPGYETHVWEARNTPSFAEAPSCYLRNSSGSAITDPNGNPIWSPAASDTELQNFSQRRINYLNKGRLYGPITYIGNMGEYASGMQMGKINGVVYDMTTYYSQDPTVMAAIQAYTGGTTNWWAYLSYAKAHQESVMHSRVASGIPELKHYYWYPSGGNFDRNRYNGWGGWCYLYEWMKDLTTYPSEQSYMSEFTTGYTGNMNLLMQRLNAKGVEIANGHPLAYDWVEGPYSNGNNAERLWIGYLKMHYTLGTLGANVGNYAQTNPLNQPDVDPANPPLWMRHIIDSGRVHALFSWIEPFVRQSSLLPGPNMHQYTTSNPAYEFPTGDADARVVARKMDNANRWLITAWAASGSDRYVTVTIPTLGTISVLARDVGSVYHANGSLTQLDSADGTLVTLDTNTLNAQLGDLYGGGGGGGVTTDVQAIAYLNSNPYVFVRGMDNGIYMNSRTGSSWSGWSGNLGTTVAAPAVCTSGGTLYLDYVGTDNAVYQRTFNGSTWSSVESLGGIAKGNPACAWLGSKLFVFVRGGDDVLYYKTKNGSWSSWSSLGGILASGPSATSNGTFLHVIIRGSDNGSWERHFDGYSWSGWGSMGGLFNAGIGCTWKTGSMYLFGLGTDNKPYQRTWNGSSWSAWTDMGGTGSSGIGAAASNAEIGIIMRGTDNAPYFRRNVNGAWESWLSLGGSIQ